MVLRPEEVDKETDPARQEDDDRADDLSGHGDGLLEDVEDGQDSQDDTDDVDDFSHSVMIFLPQQPVDKYRSDCKRSDVFNKEIY